MTKTADVAIVGGGLAGASAAHWLAKAGLRTTIIEGHGIAHHASGLAFGGLFPLSGAGIPGPMLPLALRAFALHGELAEALPAECGADIGFRRRATLAVAFAEAEADELRRTLAWINEQPGFAAQWLDASAVRKAEPRLSPATLGGTLCHGTAEVNPGRLAQALVEGAGATVIHRQAVGLALQGQSATGVLLDDGATLACGAVALATGPWLAEAARWLGAHLPVTPLKGEILRLAAPGPPLELAVSWQGHYAASKPDGLLWAGSTEAKAGFDDAPSASGRHAVLGAVRKLLPQLADAPIARQTACLRPMTPDGRVVLGPLAGWRNIVVAGGGGRKGVLYAPAMGEALADLALGRETPVDLSPLDPNRFARER